MMGIVSPNHHHYNGRNPNTGIVDYELEHYSGGSGRKKKQHLKNNNNRTTLIPNSSLPKFLKLDKQAVLNDNPYNEYHKRTTKQKQKYTSSNIEEKRKQHQ